MRITLYRTDIEAAVRSHMARLFNFPAADMLIQHGEGMIQVDLGAGPDSQDTGQNFAGLVGAAVQQQRFKPAPIGISGFTPEVGVKVTTPPTPVAVQVAEASLVAAVAESSIATALETTKASEIPEDIEQGPTDGPTPTEEVAATQVPANDSAAEPVAEPPRKVQSLFKNLKKPVNG